MAGKRLKVYQAHLGFYDTVVAAPSQKAALPAWGAGPREFAKGFAKVASDPAAIEKALAHPGQVLKRPFGSKGDYKLEADPIPTPKLTGNRRKAALAAKKHRKSTKARVRAVAERELRAARREEARALAELVAREKELARDKEAARTTARERIARARSCLASAR